MVDSRSIRPSQIPSDQPIDWRIKTVHKLQKNDPILKLTRRRVCVYVLERHDGYRQGGHRPASRINAARLVNKNHVPILGDAALAADAA